MQVYILQALQNNYFCKIVYLVIKRQKSSGISADMLLICNRNIKLTIMNYFNYNPFELAAKLIAFQSNDRVREFVGNISKAKSLIHTGQLFQQREYYQRIASLAFCCSPCEERSRTLEICHHRINDCDNEYRRIVEEILRDKTIERLTDKHRRYQY